MMIARSTDPRSAPIAWPRLSVRAILDTLAARDAVYRQRLALKELNDHMLRDMGLTRADVAEELRRSLPW